MISTTCQFDYMGMDFKSQSPEGSSPDFHEEWDYQETISTATGAPRNMLKLTLSQSPEGSSPDFQNMSNEELISSILSMSQSPEGSSPDFQCWPPST